MLKQLKKILSRESAFYWLTAGASLAFLALAVLLTSLAAPRMEPIFEIMRHGDRTALEILLDRQPSQLTKRLMGRTPLHYAVILDVPDFCRILIKHGADINAKDKYGNTSLLVATFLSRSGICRVLVGAGADATISNDFGHTPILLAAQFKINRPAAKAIIKASAELLVDIDFKANIEAIARKHNPYFASLLSGKKKQRRSISR